MCCFFFSFPSVCHFFHCFSTAAGRCLGLIIMLVTIFSHIVRHLYGCLYNPLNSLVMKFFNSLKDFIKSIDCLIVWVAISTSVTVTVMIILLQKFLQ